VDKCLVDTDVLIWYLRGRPETVKLVNQAADEFELAASVISRTEILLGMKEKERPATTALLDSLTAYTITAQIADKAGELIRHWQTKGSAITIPDALIAATVIDHDLAFLTYNRKHFPMPEISFYPDS
jgi:predicted nucleic acid-binding protein